MSWRTGGEEGGQVRYLYDGCVNVDHGGADPLGGFWLDGYADNLDGGGSRMFSNGWPVLVE